MAKQQNATPHERQRDDRGIEDIETEIDEALENVDEDEVDERLDEAIERADEEDPDEVLIELEEDEDSEATGEDGKPAGAAQRGGARK